jgi:hypothetical protein
MNATKIQGKYLCVGDLGGAYTLTGADRDANMALTTDDPVNLLAVNNKGARSIFLCGNTRTRITRARLRSPAGPGVNSAKPTAGAVVLSFCSMSGGVKDTELDAVKLSIPTWGDWFDVNLDIEPYKTAYTWNAGQIAQHKPVGVFIGYNSNLKIDDYNVQDDYVGQVIGAVLDIEIETAGVLDSSYYTIM